MLIEQAHGPSRVADVLLALFASAAGLFTLFSAVVHQADVDPYASYYANAAIKILMVAAVTSDVVIALTLVVSAARRRWSSNLAIVIYAGALVAASVPWFELWYGSTFYYGEVRDKQGLPFSVSNFGPLGTFCFLTYLIWRTRISMGERVHVVTRAIATLILALIEWAFLRSIHEPWNLWQS